MQIYKQFKKKTRSKNVKKMLKFYIKTIYNFPLNPFNNLATPIASMVKKINKGNTKITFSALVKGSSEKKLLLKIKTNKPNFIIIDARYKYPVSFGIFFTTKVAIA